MSLRNSSDPATDLTHSLLQGERERGDCVLLGTRERSFSVWVCPHSCCWILLQSYCSNTSRCASRSVGKLLVSSVSPAPPWSPSSVFLPVWAELGIHLHNSDLILISDTSRFCTNNKRPSHISTNLFLYVPERNTTQLSAWKALWWWALIPVLYVFALNNASCVTCKLTLFLYQCLFTVLSVSLFSRRI